MEFASEMQQQELELRHLLKQTAGEALDGIMKSYSLATAVEREALTAVLAARVVSNNLSKKGGQ